jgi:adenosylcobinamide-GDP ribazoletransferase
MNMVRHMRLLWEDLVVAFQFLTRIPLPSVAFAPDSLARAVKFFPVVGLFVGLCATWLQMLLGRHLSRPVAAVIVLVFLVLITGCLHEDGLADTADGFGGGRDKAQILAIIRDSRIGSYGAAALGLGLLARCLLLADIPLAHFAAYLVSAHVLCRWTTLPLSYFLRPARENDGQGARIAQLTSLPSLVTGTLFSFAVAGIALRWAAVVPILVACAVTLLSGMFYVSKVDGVTGDCFGATNQLTEIAVYVCGAWNA